MPLSAPVIVDTARRLLLQYGLQDVSMRRLATELQVRPGALYYHVHNKQELLARVAAELLRPLAAPRHDVGPQELMTEFRELILPIRDGGDLMLVAFGLDPQLPPVPALQALLLEQGLTEAEADQRCGIVLRFALGAVATEQSSALLAGASTESLQDTDARDQRPADQTAAGAALYAEGLRLLLA